MGEGYEDCSISDQLLLSRPQGFAAITYIVLTRIIEETRER